ncbi:MAG: redox-sensing transcriptional repressor Rex [Acidimicrobiales bacterium]
MPVAPAPVAGGRRLLPEATVGRLPLYLQALADADDDHQVTISSEELASRVGANAAQVRKDLSYLGSYGTRGVGYDVELLYQHIHRRLGLNRECNVALVGVGNLGQALGHYRGFAEKGFRVVAAFDTDPVKMGLRLGEAVVQPMADLDRVVRQRHVSMALITTPASAAQDVAERLVKAGVTSLLNFAPVVLNLSARVRVRKVDLAVELQILGYYQHYRSRARSSRSRSGTGTGGREHAARAATAQAWGAGAE